MRDNDLNKGIGGLLDPGYASKEDLRREKLNKFYRDHIENKKPYTARRETASVTDYIPTIALDTPQKTVVRTIVKPKEKKQPFRYESWADGIMERTEPNKKDIEKTIATFGNPKSKGKWAEFVKKNNAVDNNKKILKAKPKAMPILSYVDKMSVLYGGQEKRKYDNEGKQMAQEADRINALQKMDHFMIENSSVKHPDYPKAPPKNVTAQDIKKIYEDKKTK